MSAAASDALGALEADLGSGGGDDGSAQGELDGEVGATTGDDQQPPPTDEPEPPEPPEPNELEVKLISGTRLLEMDKPSRFAAKKKQATSDPYVTFTLCNAENEAVTKLKSTMKPKTIYPTWNESFVMRATAEMLRVEVHDHDTMTSDFMGMCEISMPPVEPAAWYTLLSKDGEDDLPRGQIQMAFEFRYNVQHDIDDGVLIQCAHCGATSAPNVVNCANWCLLHRNKGQRRHAVQRLLRVRAKVKPLLERDAMMALALGGSRPPTVAADGEEGKEERVPFGMP